MTRKWVEIAVAAIACLGGSACGKRSMPKTATDWQVSPGYTLVNDRAVELPGIRVMSIDSLDADGAELRVDCKGKKWQVWALVPSGAAGSGMPSGNPDLVPVRYGIGGVQESVQVEIGAKRIRLGDNRLVRTMLSGGEFDVEYTSVLSTSPSVERFDSRRFKAAVDQTRPTCAAP